MGWVGAVAVETRGISSRGGDPEAEQAFARAGNLRAEALRSGSQADLAESVSRFERQRCKDNISVEFSLLYGGLIGDVLSYAARLRGDQIELRRGASMIAKALRKARRRGPTSRLLVPQLEGWFGNALVRLGFLLQDPGPLNRGIAWLRSAITEYEEVEEGLSSDDPSVDDIAWNLACLRRDLGDGQLGDAFLRRRDPVTRDILEVLQGSEDYFLKAGSNYYAELLAVRSSLALFYALALLRGSEDVGMSERQLLTAARNTTKDVVFDGGLCLDSEGPAAHRLRRTFLNAALAMGWLYEWGLDVRDRKDSTMLYQWCVRSYDRKDHAARWAGAKLNLAVGYMRVELWGNRPPGFMGMSGDAEKEINEAAAKYAEIGLDKRVRISGLRNHLRYLRGRIGPHAPHPKRRLPGESIPGASSDESSPLAGGGLVEHGNVFDIDWLAVPVINKVPIGYGASLGTSAQANLRERVVAEGTEPPSGGGKLVSAYTEAVCHAQSASKEERRQMVSRLVPKATPEDIAWIVTELEYVRREQKRAAAARPRTYYEPDGGRDAFASEMTEILQAQGLCVPVYGVGYARKLSVRGRRVEFSVGGKGEQSLGKADPIKVVPDPPKGTPAPKRPEAKKGLGGPNALPGNGLRHR